jgi:membrane-bound lytic murein transglycosylase B
MTKAALPTPFISTFSTQSVRRSAIAGALLTLSLATACATAAGDGSGIEAAAAGVGASNPSQPTTSAVASTVTPTPTPPPAPKPIVETNAQPAAPPAQPDAPAPVKASSAPATAPDVAPAAAPAPAPATAPAATPDPNVAPTRPTPPHDTAYAGRADVRAFAQSLATSTSLDAAWALRHLERARFNTQVTRLMMPPLPTASATARDWTAYRNRFVEPKRIAAGVAFWRANEAALLRAQARFGVPPSIVAGIVGVETYYGRITGNFRVIDALATLAFDFPSGRRDRTPFFRTQLSEYLQWCGREGHDPQTVLGSFAGAIGWPQFMPGSINRWAVDFDGDGRVDLSSSQTDVVGSVANYLAEHGWQRDMPTHYDVVAPTDEASRALLLGPDIKPTFTAREMTEHGAALRDPKASRHEGPMALVQLLEGTRTPSYVAGTENFYVVTRYNQSSYYALAVIELGEAVAAAVRESSTAAPGDGARAGTALKASPRQRTAARAP